MHVTHCQETFKLLMADVNNSSSVPHWRRSAYTHRDVIAADHVFSDVTNATINDHTSSVAMSQQGAWLAFRDQVNNNNSVESILAKGRIAVVYLPRGGECIRPPRALGRQIRHA